MKSEVAVAADVLIDNTVNDTLDKLFAEYRRKECVLYIPFGVRRKVEESLENEELTRKWHKLFRESLQQRLIINSRHKYTLEHNFKKLFRLLPKLGKKLTMSERELIALSFQLGIDIDTNDQKIIRTLSYIKTEPGLKRYALRFFSREARRTAD